MSGKKFATVINCMDGRVQAPVVEWMRREFGVDHVDMITEPGPRKLLAEIKDDYTIESIKKRLLVSVGKHGSRSVAVIGHHDCAGNPVEKDVQLAHIHAAIKEVESWDLGVSVVGLWVDRSWKANKI